MTVSEYIFDFFENKNCRDVFMVSGSSAMFLTDALKRNPSLHPICCHHEQAAAMAADGYGRMEGAPGVCLVTVGPGATNAITGVAGAYVDSSPMFVISGQASSKILQYTIETGIRQKGTQSINLEHMVSSVTKYFAVVMKASEIKYHMEKAYYEATNGRKGPVWLDVPIDIQNQQIPEEMEGFQEPELQINQLSQEEIQQIKEDIKNSKKPLILAGYGVRSDNAVVLLEQFCNKYQIPVVTSRGGIDVIETDSQFFVGRPGSYGDRASHFVIQKCDLLIILGSRLSVSTVGYYPQRFAQCAKKIMVDIDPKELNKDDVPINMKIQSRISNFLNQILYSETSEQEYDRTEWIRYCKMLKEKYPTVLPEYEKEEEINSYVFSRLLSRSIPDNTNVVVDTGSVCNIVSQCFEVQKNQRYIISGGFSCMGFWASAIGVSRVSQGVVAITGDGSAQMNIQELATLKYHNLPLKLFIYNNNGYLLIRHNQHNYMEDRFLGVGPDSGLYIPSFIDVAIAYGIKAVKISSKEDMESKISEVLAMEGPVVCEVMVQEFGTIAPRIASKVMPDGTLKAAEFDDLWPFLDSKENDNE